MRIATGAPIPPGADAVVPVEAHDAARRRPARPPGRAAATPPGRCRPASSSHGRSRPAARSAREGQRSRAPATRILDAGTALTPAAIGLAPASGSTASSSTDGRASAILATGDEVRARGAELGRGRDPRRERPGADGHGRGGRRRGRSTWASRRTDLDDVRGRPVCRPRRRRGRDHRVGRRVGRAVRRRADGVRGVRRRSTSGGSPSSRASRSRSARPGARRRRRIRPPATLLFGLPGNPVSTFVTFELFVRPAIRAARRSPRRRPLPPGRSGGARANPSPRATAGARSSASSPSATRDGTPGPRRPWPRAGAARRWRGRAGEPRPLGARRRPMPSR